MCTGSDRRPTPIKAVCDNVSTFSDLQVHIVFLRPPSGMSLQLNLSGTVCDSEPEPGVEGGQPNGILGNCFKPSVMPSSMEIGHFSSTNVRLDPESTLLGWVCCLGGSLILASSWGKSAYSF